MSGRFYVATRKGLFTVERTAAGRDSAWQIAQAAFVGDNVTLCLPDPRDGRVYAALDHGHFGCKMHASADGGATFQEIAAPAYPPMPAGYVEPANPMNNNRPIPWTTKLIWALAAGGAAEPGRLWAGTLPGGLFTSPDHGKSWELVRSLWDDPRRREWFGGGADLPGIHSICVDPRDSRRLTIGISCGGVWQTPDAGQTWRLRAKGMRAAYMPPEQQFNENVQDPHCLVQCPSSPDRFWVQHHNGVFRSVDDSATWTEIADVQPSAFGFAVAVHPRDAERAWFVPAMSDEKRTTVGGQVVVARTTDGGRSFDVLRRGLPQQHAYDITFRHALDIAAQGDCLAFGSTTGSLWVSEDQGETWQTVSTHLPPVYCVRFAAGG